jgi:NAD(P)-dependent dehydrogenase (short-subunit alcohol dehydrogenase family)
MKPPKRLEGRVALVTGASRGIGAAAAKSLAAEGAHVILLARTKAGLEETYDIINENGGTSTIMPFDLTRLDELEALGPTILERFKRLDIWVANAGKLGTLTPVSHSKIKDWRDVYTLNVLSNVQMIRTLEPLLKASDAGRAIFVGSGMGVDPYPFYGEYGVSKAAVMFLAKTWAEETKHTNIKINIIRPGAVDTELLAEAYPGGYHAAGLRMPEDIASMFVELSLPSCMRHGETLKPEDFGL